MTLEAEHQTLTLHAPDGSNTFKNSQHGCGKQTHRFTFSKIFKETTTQKEFFASTVLNTVKDFIEGQNCLIFTYGVTNSGKTYTIQGEHLHFITSYIFSGSDLRRAIALARHRAPKCCTRRVIFSAPWSTHKQTRSKESDFSLSYSSLCPPKESDLSLSCHFQNLSTAS